ncbi:MAG: hypothetical protein ACREX8_20710, partial [Gammaproteobacteria bacterium]
MVMVDPLIAATAVGPVAVPVTSAVAAPAAPAPVAEPIGAESAVPVGVGGWRDGLSLSHRVAHLVVMSLATGTGLAMLYTSRVLTEAVAAVGEGQLFTLALWGGLIGSYTVARLIKRLPGRVRTVAAVAGYGVAYLGFALGGLVGGAWGYQAAAVVLGLAGSTWFPLFLQTDRWITATNQAREAQRPLSVRYPSSTPALLALGLPIVLGSFLIMQGVLIHSLWNTTVVSAAVAGVVAALLWFTTPSEPADRSPWSFKKLLLDPLLALRNPLVAVVNLGYLFASAMIGAFDEFWPHVMAPGLLAQLLN